MVFPNQKEQISLLSSAARSPDQPIVLQDISNGLA